MKLRYLKTFENFKVNNRESDIKVHDEHTTKVDKLADKVKEENNDVHRISTCKIINRTDMSESEEEIK